jgi:hypothetical protein
MKDFYTELELNGKKYLLCFDLNVMEAIQAEYDTIEKWNQLVMPLKGETDAKAIIFGFREMLNEGIEISNENTGADEKPLTHKQVGRILTQLGLETVSIKIGEAISKANKDESKNE